MLKHLNAPWCFILRQAYKGDMYLISLISEAEDLNTNWGWIESVCQYENYCVKVQEHQWRSLWKGASRHVTYSTQMNESCYICHTYESGTSQNEQVMSNVYKRGMMDLNVVRLFFNTRVKWLIQNAYTWNMTKTCKYRDRLVFFYSTLILYSSFLFCAILFSLQRPTHHESWHIFISHVTHARVGCCNLLYYIVAVG